MTLRMVRVAGFEPTVSWTRTKRDTKLRHTRKDGEDGADAPDSVKNIIVNLPWFVKMGILPHRERPVHIYISYQETDHGREGHRYGDDQGETGAARPGGSGDRRAEGEAQGGTWGQRAPQAGPAWDLCGPVFGGICGKGTAAGADGGGTGTAAGDHAD